MVPSKVESPLPDEKKDIFGIYFYHITFSLIFNSYLIFYFDIDEGSHDLNFSIPATSNEPIPTPRASSKRTKIRKPCEVSSPPQKKNKCNVTYCDFEKETIPSICLIFILRI